MTRARDENNNERLLVLWLLEIDSDLQKLEAKVKSDYPGYMPIRNDSKMEDLNMAQKRILNSAVNIIRKDYLEVDVEDNSNGIIKVEFTSRDEMFSLQFSKAIVEKVNTFYLNVRTKKNTDQVQILQSKVNTLNREMSGSMYAAAAAVDDVPFPNPHMKELEVAPRRKTVDVQVNSAIYSTLVQQLEAAKTTLEREAPLIQLIDEPYIPLIVKRPPLILSMIIGGIVFLTLGVFCFIGVKVYKEAVLN